MTNITVGTFGIPDANIVGTTALLRIYASENWVDSLGIFRIGGMIGEPSGFFKEIPCTVASDEITVPQFVIPSTLDSIDKPNVQLTGIIFYESGAKGPQIFTGWMIPYSPTTTTFAALTIFNLARFWKSPSGLYLNAEDTANYISQLVALSTQGITSEIPSGLIDGVNGTFTLSQTPVLGSQLVFLNGNLQPEGNLGAGTESYTISGNVITHYLPPQPGDRLFVLYRTASGILGHVADASSITEGLVRLSVAPVLSTDPVALGNNDPRAIDISSYASFSAMITAIGSTPYTFNIHGNINITANAAVPANITLRFLQGGQLTLTTGVTLTILGPIVADPVKIFYNAVSGQGTVSFSGNKHLAALQGKWWGAVGDDSTDDTSSVQAAITAAVTLKVATIRFPSGTYKIDGALQGTATQQAKLILPAIGYAGNEAVHVTIEGASAPPDAFGTVLSTLLATTKATIFKTTGTDGSVFGGSNGLDFTAAQLTMRNVVVRAPGNPQINGVNGSYLGGLFLDNVIVDTGASTTQTTQPTNTSVGIITPLNANSADQTLRDVKVQGFLVGIRVNEHTIGDNIVVSACANGLEFSAGSHGSAFGRVNLMNNTRNLLVSGVHYVSIAQLNAEHSSFAIMGTPVWQETIYDLDDEFNQLRGYLYWHAVTGGVGVSTTFLRNGGNAVATFPLDRTGSVAGAFVYNSATQTIPNNSVTALTFNTELYDNIEIHSTAVNPSRFTAAKTAVYDIIVKVDWAANATGSRGLNLRLGGVTTIPGVLTNATAEAGIITRMTATFQIPLNVGDYVEVVVFQTSGGNLDTSLAGIYSPSVAIKSGVPY